MSDDFEKKIKKMKLDPKYEKELLAMLNQESDGNPCSACAAKGTCQNKPNKKADDKTENSGGCSGCSSCGP